MCDVQAVACSSQMTVQVAMYDGAVTNNRIYDVIKCPPLNEVGEEDEAPVAERMVVSVRGLQPRRASPEVAADDKDSMHKDLIYRPSGWIDLNQII